MKVYELVSKIGGMTKCNITVREGFDVVTSTSTKYVNSLSKTELKTVENFDKSVKFFNFVTDERTKQLFLEIQVD